ncbi:MAG: DUF4268 domain-containing protein [Bacteroidota bacterium]|nr:DUF4268 domain-containing protein [Bacteroidota bacterium]
MYSRNEAAQLKKKFWTTFGQYMNPVLSVEGEKISWTNYKTGEKDIFFRMYAGDNHAVTAIEITHADADVRQLYFEQFMQMKKLLIRGSNSEWRWLLQATSEHNKITAKIYTELPGVSIYKKEDWPQLISFFKTNIVALDEFWSNVKYSFEALR